MHFFVQMQVMLAGFVSVAAAISLEVTDSGVTVEFPQDRHLVRSEPHRRLPVDESDTSDAMEIQQNEDDSKDLIGAVETVTSEIGADGKVTLRASDATNAHDSHTSQIRSIFPQPQSHVHISTDEAHRAEFALGRMASLIESDERHLDDAESGLRGGGVVVVLIILIVFVWLGMMALLLTFKSTSEANPRSDEGARAPAVSFADEAVEAPDDMAAAVESAAMSIHSMHSFSEVGDAMASAGDAITASAGDAMAGLMKSFALGDMGKHLTEHEDAGETFRDVYEVNEKLGDGAFGVVYAVVELSTGKELAVKMIDLAQSEYDDVLSELRILRRVRHENATVACVDEFMDACFYYIVMPKYSGGDLIESLSVYMEDHGLLPELTFARCFEQMTSSIDFVHSKNVVHRDIKPENFLTSMPDIGNPGNRVVLTDFGLSVVMKKDTPCLEELIGTPMFWCPEMLGKQCRYSYGCDIFALGLTAHILMAGQHAFGSLGELEKWAVSDDPAPKVVRASEPTSEMLELALDRLPEDRVTAPQLYALARGHPLLSGKAVDSSCLGDYAQVRTKNLRFGMVLDEAQLQRREQMIHHLDQDHLKDPKKQAKRKKGNVSFDLGPTNSEERRGSANSQMTKHQELSLKVFSCLPFEIPGEKKTAYQYDWWPVQQCAEKGMQGAVDALHNMVKRRASATSTTSKARPEDITYLTALFAQNNLDWRAWTNPDATLDGLAQECRRGESIIAEEEKRLIRVVDVVVPVLIAPSGDVLVIGEEKIIGGKLQLANMALPGKNRLAWEHKNVTAMRALAAVGIKAEDIKFTEKRDVVIRKEESQSCPGLLTVYRRSVLNLEFADERTSTQHLAQKGWPKGEQFVEEKDGVRKTWSWITRQSFDEQELLEGDSELAARYAAVVPARTHDRLGHADLRLKFKRCGLDTDNLPDEKLEELANEQETGECTLIEQDMGGGKYKLERVVRLAVVRVVNDNGDILVEVGKKVRDKVTEAKKFPGIKQRINENAFSAARRWLESRLMLDDDEIHFDTEAGGMIEENQDSKNYPGLQSIYEKQVIQARLAKNRLLLVLPPIAGAEKRMNSDNDKDGFSESDEER